MILVVIWGATVDSDVSWSGLPNLVWLYSAEPLHGHVRDQDSLYPRPDPRGHTKPQVISAILCGSGLSGSNQSLDSALPGCQSSACQQCQGSISWMGHLSCDKRSLPAMGSMTQKLAGKPSDQMNKKDPERSNTVLALWQRKEYSTR